MADEINFDDRQLALILVAGVALFLTIIVTVYSLAVHFNVH